MGFVGAMKQFFGLREPPKHELKHFAEEVKALSFEECVEFHKMLVEQAGIQCDAPTPK